MQWQVTALEDRWAHLKKHLEITTEMGKMLERRGVVEFNSSRDARSDSWAFRSLQDIKQALVQVTQQLAETHAVIGDAKGAAQAALDQVSSDVYDKRVLPCEGKDAFKDGLDPDIRARGDQLCRILSVLHGAKIREPHEWEALISQLTTAALGTLPDAEFTNRPMVPSPPVARRHRVVYSPARAGSIAATNSPSLSGVAAGSQTHRRTGDPAADVAKTVAVYRGRLNEMLSRGEPCDRHERWTRTGLDRGGEEGNGKEEASDRYETAATRTPGHSFIKMDPAQGCSDGENNLGIVLVVIIFIFAFHFI